MRLKQLILFLCLLQTAQADTPPVINIFKLSGGTSTGALILHSGVVQDVSPGANGNVLTASGGTWVSSPTASSGVTAVTATSPLSSSGGFTPNISCPTASGSISGCLLGILYQGQLQVVGLRQS